MNENSNTPVVPSEYSGKWIAWNFDETKIIASGTTFAETRNAALASGEQRPVLAKVPHADKRFVGGYR